MTPKRVLCPDSCFPEAAAASRSKLDMYVALLGACPQACLAAYAVFCISNGHDLVAHIVAELVITLKRLFDQFKHIPAANLIASSAAYAFIDIDGIDEFRHPHVAAACISYDFRHALSFLQSILSGYRFAAHFTSPDTISAVNRADKYFPVTGLSGLVDTYYLLDYL